MRHNMKFVHRIMYFIQFFLFIFCPFTNYLHAPLTQYHTNHSILQKRLFDTDSRAFSFTFRFDPRLTRYCLRSSIVWNTVFFFFLIYSFIFSRPLNSIENKSLTIHSIPAYQGRSYFCLGGNQYLSRKFEYQTIPSFDDPETENFSKAL